VHIQEGEPQNKSPEVREHKDHETSRCITQS